MAYVESLPEPGPAGDADCNALLDHIVCWLMAAVLVVDQWVSWLAFQFENTPLQRSLTKSTFTTSLPSQSDVPLSTSLSLPPGTLGSVE